MGIVHYLIIHIALLFLSSWLIWNGIKPLLRQSAEYVSVPVFKKTNYYLLLVMLLLSSDRLFMLA